MIVESNKFSELDEDTKLKVVNDYINGWKETHNEILSIDNAQKCCIDLEEEVFYNNLGEIIEDLDLVMGKCRICGLEFTKLDYIHASKGFINDECLVGDFDDICYPCQFKQDNNGVEK